MLYISDSISHWGKWAQYFLSMCMVTCSTCLSYCTELVDTKQTEVGIDDSVKEYRYFYETLIFGSSFFTHSLWQSSCKYHPSTYEQRWKAAIPYSRRVRMFRRSSGFRWFFSSICLSALLASLLICAHFSLDLSSIRTAICFCVWSRRWCDPSCIRRVNGVYDLQDQCRRRRERSKHSEMARSYIAINHKCSDNIEDIAVKSQLNIQVRLSKTESWTSPRPTYTLQSPFSPLFRVFSLTSEQFHFHFQ